MTRGASGSPKKSILGTLLLCILTLVLVLSLVLSILYRLEYPAPYAEGLSSLPTLPETVWPESVVVPDGRADSLICLDSYSVSLTGAGSSGKQTVATMNDAKLTGDMLQIFYLNAIRSYLLSTEAPLPDLSEPLEQQLCPLGDGKLSWQHYFLEKAIDDWKTEALLLQAAQQKRPIKEEAYKPNETRDLHGEYVAADLPVNGFLYADQDCYTPNSMHQQYLDGLQEQMDALAQQRGFRNLEDYSRNVLGVSEETLVQAARNYNTAYMFFTEETYELEVTEEEIDAYLSSPSAKSLTDGNTDTVTIRHILLIPNGATVSEDGTVKAKEKKWSDCERTAQEIYWDSQQSYLVGVMGKEAYFAQKASQLSADEGSRCNGGLYENIRPGQLIDVLDKWCFDEDRQSEDITVLRSKLGYHVVFFCRRNDAIREAARETLMQQKQLERWQKQKEQTEVKVSYNLIQLWADCREETVLPVDVLYPDIAHERFPEAIVYFQQDYMYSPYGGSYVGRGGCGITTMAMLSTYMTDTIYTPDMLARRYPQYHDASGTRGELFRYVPAELGFYYDDYTSDIEEVIQALKEGKRVVSLQYLGHFTRGGHYLLLQQYYEDTDTFQVRDSNIYNYGRLDGHKVDYFTRADILSGATTFYIMQEKNVTIPACCRCGDQRQPEKLLQGDYLCSKCQTALLRRNAFLSLMD